MPDPQGRHGGVQKNPHGTKKRTSANIREAKVKVSKDELSKLLMVGTELTKEIRDIKRAWGPKQDTDKDKDKGKDKKGKSRWRKKGDAVNKVAGEEDTPTTDAPWWSPRSQGPQPGLSEDGAAVNAAPSTSGIIDSPGGIPSRMPGAGTEVKKSRNSWVWGNAGGISAPGGPMFSPKVPGEGTNSCTQSSFAAKNVFHVLHHLSETVKGSPGPPLEAADGLLEPITHDLHKSLIELLFQEASPSYRVSPTSQVTVSGWGSREEKGAVDSGFVFVQKNLTCG